MSQGQDGRFLGAPGERPRGGLYIQILIPHVSSIIGAGAFQISGIGNDYHVDVVGDAAAVLTLSPVSARDRAGAASGSVAPCAGYILSLAGCMVVEAGVAMGADMA